MIVIAVISLILGIIFGKWVFNQTIVDIFSLSSNYILYLLFFAVGISVGSNKLIFKKIKEYNVKILTIPLGIIIGTTLGGIVSGLILNIPLKESVSIASGMGWYSFSGILITDLSGAKMGTIAFLSNLIRELLSFLLIPFIVKYLNYYTAIASAGATSGDTTLPILIKYTNGEVVIMAIINGVICSGLVPLLTPFFYKIFSL